MQLLLKAWHFWTPVNIILTFIYEHFEVFYPCLWDISLFVFCSSHIEEDHIHQTAKYLENIKDLADVLGSEHIKGQLGITEINVHSEHIMLYQTTSQISVFNRKY